MGKRREGDRRNFTESGGEAQKPYSLSCPEAPPARPLSPPGFLNIPGPGLLRVLGHGRALGCNGDSGEAPLAGKLLPPGEIWMGASRAPPSSPGGGVSAPHARHRAVDSSPPNVDTHFFVEDGLHVYLSGANGPRAEPPPSSSAPGPTPPPPPRPTTACPAHVPHVDQ